MSKWLAIGLLLLSPMLFTREVGPAQQPKPVVPAEAVAMLHATGNSGVHGVVRFSQKDGFVQITGQVVGLTPGLHGFHVHEYGDCSALDAGSAGGHFNPTNMPHGGPDDKKRHVGDLGNIKADAKGRATINMQDKVIQLRGPYSIVGRSLIVHAKADDLKTQPHGRRWRPGRLRRDRHRQHGCQEGEINHRLHPGNHRVRHLQMADSVHFRRS